MAPKKTTRKTVTTRKPVAKSKEAQTKPPQNPAKLELISILDGLNLDEINWLNTQAQTMVYNHKVEELNKSARNLADSKKHMKTAASPKTGSSKNAVNDTVDIIQAGGPKNFNILLGNSRLFLNLQELKALVKIAVAANDSGDGAGRLYRWFSKERSDILKDGGISNPADKRLKVIYSILKDRFTVG
ncbi:MAG: hypothetical protein DRP70_03905 [Spirochaetes bacterium]|nr:MAG: hypothetical protein DRP70_03905 [Spirochaetota bacterium]